MPWLAIGSRPSPRHGKRLTINPTRILGVLLWLIVVLQFVLTPKLEPSSGQQPSNIARLSAVVDVMPPALTVDPHVYKPLTEFDAVSENARRPLDRRAIQLAPPFIIPMNSADGSDLQQATHCLALANYYEAASEGLAGMRAVSQVVLNRMRHPAFPNSVCEVVFQGAERPTGCQFTFTCDGSLKRPTNPTLFARAQAVAAEALRGRVEVSVGMATHYHANFVVPYWADSLDKIRTVGAHIFYVWRGTWGNRTAFNAAYAGERNGLMVPPSVPLAVVDETTDLTRMSRLASAVDNVTLELPRLAEKPADRAFLVADEAPRSLKLDENGNVGKLNRQPLLQGLGNRIVSDGN